MARGWTVRSLKALAATLIIGAVAFVTGLLLFDSVVAPRLVRGGNDVQVPDLSNLSAEQSKAALAQVGLGFAVGSQRYDPAAPKGFVISQEPEAERWVRSGRRVSVVLSLGEEFANVPELHGESERSARLLLSRAGLRPGRLRRVVTPEVGPDLVVATAPAAGASVPRGTSVDILLCVAGPVDTYVMPDLVGRDAQAAARDLEGLGFRVETVGPGSSFSRIEAHTPQAGARVVRGQAIVLTVAGRLIQ